MRSLKGSAPPTSWPSSWPWRPASPCGCTAAARTCTTRRSFCGTEHAEPSVPTPPPLPSTESSGRSGGCVGTGEACPCCPETAWRCITVRNELESVPGTRQKRCPEWCVLARGPLRPPFCRRCHPREDRPELLEHGNHVEFVLQTETQKGGLQIRGIGHDGVEKSRIALKHTRKQSLCCGCLTFARCEQLDIQRERSLVIDQRADDARVIELRHFLALDLDTALSAFRAATLP